MSLCIFLAAACKSEHDESVTFHDRTFGVSVKRELDISKVPYKETADGAIWYPVSYRNKVKVAISKVSSEMPLAFNFFDRHLESAFVSRLKKENINFTEGEIDGGYKIIVDGKSHDKATGIFHEIMGK